MDKDVPLIVPERLIQKTLKDTKILLQIQIALQFKWFWHLIHLHQKFNIKRVVVSTYQAVSGAGKAAMDELMSQTKDFFK